MKNPSPLTFPSMRAASGASGIPPRVLSAWKAAGIPGFHRNGEVRLNEALAAAFARAEGDMGLPEGVTSWREVLLRAQARRTETKLAKERGDLTDSNLIASKIQAAAGNLRVAIFDQIQEAPARLAAAGGDVAAIREVFRDIAWQQFEIVRATMAPAFEAIRADTKAAMASLVTPSDEKTNKETNRREPRRKQDRPGQSVGGSICATAPAEGEAARTARRSNRGRGVR